MIPTDDMYPHQAATIFVFLFLLPFCLPAYLLAAL